MVESSWWHMPIIPIRQKQNINHMKVNALLLFGQIHHIMLFL
jgi:hypothetical protein